MAILSKVCDEFEIEFGNRPVAPPHDPVGEMYGHKRDTHGKHGYAAACALAKLRHAALLQKREAQDEQIAADFGREQRRKRLGVPVKPEKPSTHVRCIFGPPLLRIQWRSSAECPDFCRKGMKR